MLVQQFADFLGYNIEPVVLYKVLYLQNQHFFMACNNYCYINTVHIIIIMLLVVNKLHCKI